MSVHQLTVGVVVVAIRAIPAGVDRFVDIAICLGALEQLDRCLGVTRFGRSGPGVDRYFERSPGSEETLLHLISEYFGLCSGCFGGRNNMLAVLVQAHAKSDVIAN